MMKVRGLLCIGQITYTFQKDSIYGYFYDVWGGLVFYTLRI